MITTLIIGGVVVYIVASYVVVGKFLSDSPGPAGLGWLAFPIAPLLLPMAIFYGIKSFFRRIFS